MYLVDIQFDYKIYYECPKHIDLKIVSKFIDYIDVCEDYPGDEINAISDIALVIVPDLFVGFGSELKPSAKLKIVSKAFILDMVELWKKYDAHRKIAEKIRDNIDYLFDTLDIKDIIE